jgi:RNA polymerase sigma-70 factor (family 1)
MAGINQVGFDQIFMDWYYPVRNFIYYKTGDMQVAEDLAQDTFLKVWERRETIDILTVKSLLYKIANNMFLNRIDHEKVMLKFASENQASEYSMPPDYIMEMNEFDDRLQQSISAMDEKNRTVFLMNRIDDLTYTQIAQNLGLSVKAVEKRMSKAIAFLKQRLEVKV